MDKALAASISIAAVAAAAVTGARNGPQSPSNAAWYAALRKPPATPPGAAVGAAWSTLELLLATAGYRLLRAPAGSARTLAMGAWSLTLAGLAGYPYLFFGRKQLGLSLGASATMLASTAVLAGSARQADRVAAELTLPLLGWLAFATFLSEELWRRNPRASRG